MFTAIVAAIIVLGFLILFHEMGHFLVAKRAGVRVLKFSIGFGPKLFGRRFGDTDYVVSAIPLGGFVKMVGEDPEEEISEVDKPFSFNHKPLWKRTAIVLAGPVANLLLAFLAFTLAFMLYGAQVPGDAARVGGLIKGMPAEAAGLEPGDVILAVNSQPIENWEKLSEIISASGGNALDLTVEREGERFDLQVVPQAKEDKNIFGEVQGTAFRIGIERGFVTQQVSLVEAVQMGGSQTMWWVRTLVLSVWKLIRGSIPADQIGGPILIVQAAGEQAQKGLEDLLHFMAMISVNLAVLNLLPIPILDGGHLFFFLIEGVLRRPLALRQRLIAQQLGFVVLIGLMAFALYNDIARNVQSWWG
jgi:regulator of sigma E protease